MRRSRHAALVLAGLAGLVLSSCASGPAPARFQDIAYASWNESEPAYRLYPGDVLDVALPSAPELSRQATVQPDGRIALPYIQPVMVADRTITEAEQALAYAYAPVLRRPEAQISVKTATPLKIFVGGEVDHPGAYDMPGDINALQAVYMAGGFKPSARASEVIVIRRGADGRAMARTVNLSAASHDARADSVPLRRFDIVIVPRSPIAQLGLAVQQYLRDPLPIQFTYAINGQQYLTTK
jgi:protein involved in polysaccharide export with SLBB domain